jgi:hypothetical protein
MPELRLAFDAALADIVEAHAIENVLPCRQAIDQNFRHEVAFRQCVGGYLANDGLEALHRRTFDLHPRRAIGARPDHGRVGRDIARLNAAGDKRTVGGAAEVRSGEAAETGNGACRGGADQQLTPAQALLVQALFVEALSGAYRNRHRSTLVESRRRCA